MDSASRSLRGNSQSGVTTPGECAESPIHDAGGIKHETLLPIRNIECDRRRTAQGNTMDRPDLVPS